MSTTLVEGPPDDFWSKKEEQSTAAEIDESVRTTPPYLGRRVLYWAVFDPRQPVNSPYVLGGDPYDRLWFLSPN